jgi:hypothetical protein
MTPPPQDLRNTSGTPDDYLEGGPSGQNAAQGNSSYRQQYTVPPSQVYQ